MAISAENADASALALGAARPPRRWPTRAAVDALTRNARREARADALSAAASARQELIALGAGALLGFAAAIWIARSVGRGLARAVQLADDVARGDLGVTVEARGHDEIADLMRALGRMVRQLRGVGDTVRAIAGGDLTVDFMPRSPSATPSAGRSRP